MLPETQMRNIKEQGVMLSLEAVAGNESFASAVQQLPDFLGSVKTLFKALTFEPMEKNVYYGSPLDKTANKIGKMEYLDFNAVTMPVPEGLIVPYAEYLEKLLTAAKHVQDIETRVLKPFQEWLGRGLGSPSALSSVTSSLRLDIAKEEAAIVRLERDILSCFASKGTRSSEVPYTTALRKQGDWAEIRKNMGEVERIFSEEFEEGMRKRLRAIDILLDTLVERLQAKKEGYELSPKTLTELANAARLIAREFEYYSIVRYRVDTFALTLELANEKLSKF